MLAIIQNSHKSHELLCELAMFMDGYVGKTVYIDFSKVDFFAANLFSVLGCIFAENNRDKEVEIHCNMLQQSVTNSMRKTGFGMNLSFTQEVNHIIYVKMLKRKVHDSKRGKRRKKKLSW